MRVVEVCTRWRPVNAAAATAGLTEVWRLGGGAVGNAGERCGPQAHPGFHVILPSHRDPRTCKSERTPQRRRGAKLVLVKQFVKSLESLGHIADPCRSESAENSQSQDRGVIFARRFCLVFCSSSRCNQHHPSTTSSPLIALRGTCEERCKDDGKWS